MSPQGGQDPGQIARWIATGQPSHRAVLRALGEVLMAVADHETAVAKNAPDLDAWGDPMTDRSAATPRGRFVAPALPPDASTDDIALWLADTRTRAHQLIDESVTAAQEVLNQRAAATESGDSTAQAQRHAQRLAIERLRRAVADLTLEVRGVHGRLDRMEALLRQLAGGPAAALETTEASHALAAAVAAHQETAAALEDIEEATLPALTELTSGETGAAAHAAPISREPEPAEAEPEATITPTGEAEPPQPKTTVPSQEPAPLSDARAAVEAAVASALQEARRAASESAAPRVERPTTLQPRAALAREPEPEPIPAPSSAPAPAPIAADEQPRAWAAREAPSESPVESPRAVLGTPEATTEQSIAAARDEADTPTSTPRPAVMPSAAPQDAPPAAASAQEATSAAGRPGLWVPPSAVAPPRAVPARPVAPPSAAPPEPSSTSASLEQAPAAARSTAQAPTMAPARAVAASEQTSQPAAEPARRSATEDTGIFFPDGGPVVLRIAPISGFQGLMRVQDSVVQLGAVREATVEAYARGEARLRLQLVAALEPDELAESLSSSLGMRAGLQSVSDEERSIQIALG